jgi:hypothetical protein
LILKGLRMTTIHDICDTERLRKSNDLAWKWFCRSDADKRQFFSWSISVWKNPNEFKKTLSPAMKSAFTKDLKNMFYAKQIESVVITQYHAMVKFVLNKIRHTDQEYDHLLNIGLNAVRVACWQFRTVGNKCGFTTFCHNSVFLRIKSDKSKEFILKTRRSKKALILSQSEFDEKFDMRQIQDRDFRNLQFDFEEAKEILGEVVKRAKLKEHELFLLESLIKRFDHIQSEDNRLWYSEYIKKYGDTFPNGRISREGLRQRVVKLQKKIWFHWHDIQKLPITEMPKLSLRRAI